MTKRKHVPLREPEVAFRPTALHLTGTITAREIAEATGLPLHTDERGQEYIDSRDIPPEGVEHKGFRLGGAAGAVEPQPTCVWREEDPWGQMPDTYATDCGEMWSFVDGGPTENRVRYCHRCGKPVTVVPYSQPVDEDAPDGVKPAWLTEPPTGQAFPTVDKLFDALGVPVAHNNHPLRHHDRTCPACNPDGVTETGKDQP